MTIVVEEDSYFCNWRRESVLCNLSVYVDIDALHLYRAGKASGWHAGVLLAAPTVLSTVGSQSTLTRGGACDRIQNLI
jgi:hypothetical protein